MPKCSLATWENQIREHDMSANLTRSAVKKLAKTMSRDHEAYIHTPNDMELLLAYVLDFWDETGELATDNVMAENATNAQRRITR